jgi:hypothetical protein
MVADDEFVPNPTDLENGVCTCLKQPASVHSHLSQMITHADIDARILRMLEACAQKIDRDPSLLDRVGDNAARIIDINRRMPFATIEESHTYFRKTGTSRNPPAASV